MYSFKWMVCGGCNKKGHVKEILLFFFFFYNFFKVFNTVNWHYKFQYINCMRRWVLIKFKRKSFFTWLCTDRPTDHLNERTLFVYWFLSGMEICFSFTHSPMWKCDDNQTNERNSERVLVKWIEFIVER